MPETTTMGSLRDEWKRFERRRLRPIVRRLRRSRQAAGRSAQASGSMEQLLVALLRSEIRRTHAGPGAGSVAPATRSGLLNDSQRPVAGELEGLVRAMLATPASPVTAARREAA